MTPVKLCCVNCVSFCVCVRISHLAWFIWRTSILRLHPHLPAHCPHQHVYTVRSVALIYLDCWFTKSNNKLQMTNTLAMLVESDVCYPVTRHSKWLVILWQFKISFCTLDVRRLLSMTFKSWGSKHWNSQGVNSKCQTTNVREIPELDRCMLCNTIIFIYQACLTKLIWELVGVTRGVGSCSVRAF